MLYSVSTVQTSASARSCRRLVAVGDLRLRNKQGNWVSWRRRELFDILELSFGSHITLLRILHSAPYVLLELPPPLRQPAWPPHHTPCQLISQKLPKDGLGCAKAA